MSYPLMINSFPGSDDTRGTTTRIKITNTEPEGSGYSPVMRVDELKGVLGDALNFFNMTKFVANSCRINQVDAIETLNYFFDDTRYFDDFTESINYIQNSINARISQVCQSLQIDEISFEIRYVDILRTDINTSGLHNESGSHSVFNYINWEVVVYGQFTPNPLIEPVPEPIPCACFTPTWFVTSNFGNSNNNGIAVANSDNETGVPQVLGHIYVKAYARAILNATATITTANFLTENVFYTLKYDISANQMPILTPGTNSEATIKVNNVVVAVFPLDTIAKSGYIQFLAPTGWTNPYTTFQFTYSKAFGDRTSYASQEMWACKFELCNASCQNIMP